MAWGVSSALFCRRAIVLPTIYLRSMHLIQDFGFQSQLCIYTCQGRQCYVGLGHTALGTSKAAAAAKMVEVAPTMPQIARGRAVALPRHHTEETEGSLEGAGYPTFTRVIITLSLSVHHGRNSHRSLHIYKLTSCIFDSIHEVGRQDFGRRKVRLRDEPH